MTSPIALTIAGSDSSGGAGIQADIKTLSALGVYSASVITSITAQNTCGVSAVHPLPLAIVEDQIRAVFEDLNISSVKIGMLNTANTISLVTKLLKEYQPEYIVLDPVMVSTSGKNLIEPDAIDALKAELIPISSVITPNLPEAAKLLNIPLAKTKEDMYKTVSELKELGATSVLLKGGHLPGDYCIDILIDACNHYEYIQSKILTNNTHGTGCTLSSAICAFLAFGNTMENAVSKANLYLNNALKQADTLVIGKGSGPVHHFYNQW